RFFTAIDVRLPVAPAPTTARFSLFLSSASAAIRCIENCFTRLVACGKCAMKPGDVRSDSCEQPERLDRLMNAHPAATQHAGALRGRSLDELRIDRRVDDIGSPMRPLERGYRHRIAGKPAHSHLCRIDDTVGSRDLTLEVA